MKGATNFRRITTPIRKLSIFIIIKLYKNYDKKPPETNSKGYKDQIIINPVIT